MGKGAKKSVQIVEKGAKKKASEKTRVDYLNAWNRLYNYLLSNFCQDIINCNLTLYSCRCFQSRYSCRFQFSVEDTVYISME